MKKFFILFCTAVVLILNLGFVACGKVETSANLPKLNVLLTDVETYECDNFSITMQSGLQKFELDKSKADIAYKSDYVIFTEKKINKPDNMSLNVYIKLCLDGVEKQKTMVYPVSVQNKSLYAGYTANLNNEETFHLVYVFESQNYFFCVNFVCSTETRHTFEPAFMKWADSVSVWDYNASNNLIMK